MQEMKALKQGRGNRHKQPMESMCFFSSHHEGPGPSSICYKDEELASH